MYTYEWKERPLKSLWIGLMWVRYSSFFQLTWKERELWSRVVLKKMVPFCSNNLAHKLSICLCWKERCFSNSSLFFLWTHSKTISGCPRPWIILNLIVFNIVILTIKLKILGSLFYILVFWDRISLCNPGCSETHYADESGLKLTEICLPLPLEFWD